MDYKPDEYWKERGKRYKTDFDSSSKGLLFKTKYNAQMKLLASLLSRLSFESVLEVGCGFGRVTKLVVDGFPRVERYDALDLSPDQLKNAESYVDSGKVRYQVTAFQDFQPEGGAKYDLVLASEVLLHVLPGDIESFIGKMLTLSNKHVIHIDPNGTTSKKFVAHNFPHDYRSIYSKFGNRIQSLEVDQVKGKVFSIFPVDFKQAIFHVVVVARQ